MDALGQVSQVTLQNMKPDYSVQGISIGGQNSSVNMFEKLLTSVETNANASSSRAADHQEVARKFEAMVMSQFIGEVFKEQFDRMFEEGVSRDFYASTFSDAIAEKLVENGGLGLSKII